MKLARTRRKHIRVLILPERYYAHCFTRLVQRKGQRCLPWHWRWRGNIH